MVRKRYLLLFLTLVLGLGLLALDRYTRSPASLSSDQKVREADYYGVNLVNQSYNEQGLLSETLYADRSDHFPGEKTTYFTQPRILTHDAHSSTLTAVRGNIKDNNGQLFLNGKVRIESESADGSQLLLTTNTLTYNSKNQVARTKDRVVITGPGSRIEGTGMRYDVRNERLQLNSKVTTRYEPQ